MITTNDLEIIRGDDVDLSITFTNDDTDELIDLTGWTVWFTVRKSFAATNIINDEDAVISKKIETFTELGVANISLADKEGEEGVKETDIDAGIYFADIQYKKPDGKIKSIKPFRFVVLDDATRDR